MMMMMLTIVAVKEVKTEWQWHDGAGTPQCDWNADVEQRHEDERNDVEDEEVDHGVDASVERQSVEAVRRVRAGPDDVVGDQPRQRVDAAQQPRTADHDAVNRRRPETTV